MTFEQIVTFASLGISAISIIFSFLNIRYQIICGQAFEKEKEKLEIYSKFLAYCEKKASGTSTPEDDFELAKVHTKLALITDHELNEHTTALYDSLFTNPRSAETVRLISVESQQMWLRLKIFNRRRGQRFPRF